MEIDSISPVDGCDDSLLESLELNVDDFWNALIAKFDFEMSFNRSMIDATHFVYIKWKLLTGKWGNIPTCFSAKLFYEYFAFYVFDDPFRDKVMAFIDDYCGRHNINLSADIFYTPAS